MVASFPVSLSAFVCAALLVGCGGADLPRFDAGGDGDEAAARDAATRQPDDDASSAVDGDGDDAGGRAPEVDAGSDAGTPRPLAVAYKGSGASRGAAADDGTLNIGHQFTVTEGPVVMRELGVWDQAADGLSLAHRVTLFALDGLGAGVHATPVPGGSVEVPAGQVAPLEEGFRFAPLDTPVTLQPGPYAVVAYGMNAADPYGDGGNLPVPATGVRHEPYAPFQFVDAQSPAYPSGGDSFPFACASFRYEVDVAPLRILPMGDSITFGVGGTQGGYRAMLAEKLTAQGVLFQFVGTQNPNPGPLADGQRFHEGHSGWTISAGTSGRDGLYEHVNDWMGTRGAGADVVLLMIGTNDVNIDYQLESADLRLEALLLRMEELKPRVRFVVAQIVPIVNDEAGDTRARAYNERIAALVTRMKEAGHAIQLVDMHGALGADDFADNLHPNDAGFAKMAQVWFDALTAGP